MKKPTREEVKAVIKPNIGIVSTYFNRQISTRITRYLVMSSVTPNQVSVFSFLLGIAAAYFISTGIPLYLIIGGILVQLSFTFDCVDGEIARLKKLSSKKGAWFEDVSDELKNILLFFGITAGLYNQTGNWLVWMFGFIAVSSVLMTNLTAIIGISAL